MGDRDRWARVNDIFHRAIERPISERGSFLREACGDDESLRGDVDTLLAAHAGADRFLEGSPVDSLASAATTFGTTLGTGRALSPGDRLAQHEIVEFVGAGGMGEVYRARDTRLHRSVAIKVLPAPRLGEADARARLMREARSAATLNHPNICTVYEVGEATGHAYIVMEFIEGQSLQVLAAHGVPPDDVLRYGVQLAEALSHAHGRGVVHRDFKTSNVMVTAEGRVKVLDFGLAKRQASETALETLDPSLTAPGTIVGTVAYMAPEQLRGERCDARTDVWALGVVLYEMAAGFAPFEGRTLFDLSSSILHDAPHQLPVHIPVPLASVIERCLSKDTDARYRDAREVRTALDDLAHSLVPPPISRANPVHRRVAVFPLRNLSGDVEQDYLVEGIHEALITDLAGVSGLRVIARPSVMRHGATFERISDVAAQLKADVVLTGSVMRSNNRVRLTAQLVDPATEEYLWSGRYDRTLAEVFTLQNEVVFGVAQALGVRLSPPERARLMQRRAIDPAAYEAYLKGRFYWSKLSSHHSDTAIAYFEEALRRDPQCAVAYAGIASVWMTRGDAGFVPPRDAYPPMKSAVVKAMETDDSLAEVHEIAGNMHFLYEWHWPAAEAAFRRAIELNPNYADGHFFYSDFLITMHRVAEAEAELARALELDPLNPLMRCFAGWHLTYRGQTEAAISQLQAVLQLEPNFPSAHLGLWGGLYRQGLLDDALAAAAKFFAVIGDSETEGALTASPSSAGYTAAMRRAADVLVDRGRQCHVPAFRVARLYAHAGDADQTFAWLEKALERHEPPLIHLGVGWDWDCVRGDARFNDLLRRIGLPSVDETR